jgi:Big-like domain-containing protein
MLAIVQRTTRLLWLAEISIVAVLAPSGCGGDGDGSVDPDPTVASVSVAPASSTVAPGDALQLTATPRDASGAALSGHVIAWSSANPAVATVSTAGLVTAIAEGQVSVTATTEGKSGQAAITVRVLDVSGDWTFSETISDPALALSCTDQSSMTFTQTGTAFTGSSQQTGTCTLAGTPFDNSGPFDITDGQVLKAAISFTEPGQPPCNYQGTLSGDPPTLASGTVSCVGNVSGLGNVNATGTWQIAR